MLGEYHEANRRYRWPLRKGGTSSLISSGERIHGRYVLTSTFIAEVSPANANSEIIHAPAPDLLIVHSFDSHHSLELHGYPPWLLRLSEILYASSFKLISVTLS